MRLYLDDDTAAGNLAGALRKAGHQIILPSQLGSAGDSDARHLVLAIQNGLVLLTRNHKDFSDLHDLVIESGGRHLGILSIRFDNDRKRDMKARDIVRAIAKLEASALQLSNQLEVLNHWR